MCGIVGYVGDREATDILFDGLKRLEYRGYDSAGIAVLNGGGIEIERAQGKLSELGKRIARHKPRGHIGIGHTRWATHGVPSERNAHPQRVGDVVVVHNGIIENFLDLRKDLIRKGCRFQSETDTEIFCHLIHEELKKTPEMKIAMARALAKVRGSYALVVLYAKKPKKLYIAKQGSPLVVGVGRKENWVASDIPALLPHTRDVLFLEDGEAGEISPEHVEIHGLEGRAVNRKTEHIEWDPVMAEKGGYKHFMLKEIFEQPRVVQDALMGRIQPESGRVVLKELSKILGEKGFAFKQVQIIACGTAGHAGMVGKYWLESFARIPTTVTLASEFRYADPILGKETLVVAISQSGETADTLAAARLAKERKAKVVAICNCVGSSLTRLAHATLYTHAGPEIGVASTKAFVAQLVVLYLLTLELAQRRRLLDHKEAVIKLEELRKVPQYMEKILRGAAAIKTVAEKCADASHFLFIARGPNYPLALEGALKLKEISYVHAEGFAAGELKHGPIAMIEEKTPVIVLNPASQTYEKVLGNIEECKSRGAYLIALGEEGDKSLREKSDAWLPIPKSKFSLTPILYAVPLQLFAYYIADLKGTDVDQPRNLAKSVTVE